jgi:hypothetical protein
MPKRRTSKSPGADQRGPPKNLCEPELFELLCGPASEFALAAQDLTQNNSQSDNVAVPCSSPRLYHNVLYDTSRGDQKMNLQHAAIGHSFDARK